MKRNYIRKNYHHYYLIITIMHTSLFRKTSTIDGHIEMKTPKRVTTINGYNNLLIMAKILSLDPKEFPIYDQKHSITSSVGTGNERPNGNGNWIIVMVVLLMW